MRVGRMSIVAAALSPLVLASCAGPSPAEVARLNALVGHSEADLLRVRGVPTRSYRAGAETFLAYDQTSVTTDYDDFGPFGGFGPYGGFGYGGFYGAGFGSFPGGFGGFAGGPTTVTAFSCQTTFEVSNTRVVGWRLHGDGC